MNVRGLANLGVEKADKRIIEDDIAFNHRRNERQNIESSGINLWRKDSFDSAPSIEHYNNYTPNGMLCDDICAQQTAHIETQPTTGIDIAATITVAETQSDAANEPMSEIDRLVQALLENDVYSSKVNSYHGQNGLGVSQSDLVAIDEWRALGAEILKNMSSEDYELLQKMLWTTIKDVYAQNPKIQGIEIRDRLILLDNYKDYDLISIWGNQVVASQTGPESSTVSGSMGGALRDTLSRFINLKMWVEGLSEVERAFLPQVAYTEKMYGPNSTFSNKMGSIADYVNAQFDEARRALPATDRFTITFNRDFTFNVRGGTGDNANFLQGVFNNAGEWLFLQVTGSIFQHRGEGGTIAPWMVTDYFNDKWRELAETHGLGYTQVSEEFLDALKSFSSAHSRKLTEDWLQKQYGFGLNDLIYKDGKLFGKTDEITKKLNDDEWLLRQRDEIIRVMKLPVENDFSYISMVYENGQFSIVY